MVESTLRACKTRECSSLKLASSFTQTSVEVHMRTDTGLRSDHMGEEDYLPWSLVKKVISLCMTCDKKNLGQCCCIVQKQLHTTVQGWAKGFAASARLSRGGYRPSKVKCISLRCPDICQGREGIFGVSARTSNMMD